MMGKEMKTILKLMIFIVTSLILTSCSGPESTREQSFGNSERFITLGGSVYTSEEIDSSVFSTRDQGEECFIYYANERYLVYGISKADNSNSYLLTKNLNLFDFKTGTVIKSIPFAEPAYVGDAIIKGDSLYYCRIPIAEVTGASASWEIHEASGSSDVTRIKGISSYCDSYPHFAFLNEKVLFSYEDQNDKHEFTCGCKLIDDDRITTLFSYPMILEEDNRTSFLDNEIFSNGETVFAFLSIEGKLNSVFFNDQGIISKTLFQDHSYHCGMLKSGLILSQVINQDMQNQYYQVSIISDAGKSDHFRDRNNKEYYRFTSGPVNHSMAVTDHALYFFEYKNGGLNRTKISIPGAKLSNVMPFYIGGNDYLIEDFSNQGHEMLFRVHIE
jgi:hypothetical protein